MKNKWKINLMALALLLLSPMSGSAQSRFFITLDAESGNVYPLFPFFIAQGLTMLNEDFPFCVNPGLNSRYARYFNDGVKMKSWGYNKSFKGKDDYIYNLKRNFGWHAEDIFRDIDLSLKFGYQPELIPVGFYARIGYAHENFRLMFSQDEDGEWTKYRIDTFRPGLGIRISPLEFLMEEDSGAPIIEIGSTYNYHLGLKGGFDGDKKELNNGLSTHVGLGWKWEGASLILDIEHDHYELFNKEYELGNVRPYEKIHSRRWNFSIVLAKDF